MKNKILKFGILSVAIMTCSLSISSVNAAENCKTYTDYYFFLNESDADGDVYNTGTINGGNSYYKPIDTTKYQIDMNSLRHGTATLSDSCSTDQNTPCWTYTQFYTALQYMGNTAEPNGTLYNDSVTVSGLDKPYKYVWIQSESTPTKYYVHKTWDDNQSIKDSDIIGSVIKNSIEDLKASTCTDDSFCKRKVGQVTYNDNYLKIEVPNITVDVSGLQGFLNKVKSEGKIEKNGKKQALFPVLAYVTYDVCDKEDEPTTPKYNVTVEYECQDLKGNVMTCPGGNPKAHKETGKEDGSSVKVTSPTIDTCETKSKEVVGKIEGQDFYQKVIYKCNPKLNDSPSNPGTGDVLIITAWVIGIGSLGYATYYFYNLKKSKAKN